jgi:hypothetical protein
MPGPPRKPSGKTGSGSGSDEAVRRQKYARFFEALQASDIGFTEKKHFGAGRKRPLDCEDRDKRSPENALCDIP